MKDKDKFSIENEPVFQDIPFEADPSEKKIKKTSSKEEEIDQIRDSVYNEPAFESLQPIGTAAMQRWLERKRAECTWEGNILATILAAVLAGPFAVIGAFMAGHQGVSALIYAILFGPIIEELLKQAGMTYLLDRQPYRIFNQWQFIFAAVVSALIFASIENVLYIYVYVSSEDVSDFEVFKAFRWIVGTTLHITCSVVASLGLIQVWKQQLRDHKPMDLSIAYPYFVTAIVMHGLYNLIATLFNDSF